MDLHDPDPVAVARRLLGCEFSSHSNDGTVTIRITETEAYSGLDDPASHAFNGLTTRNAVMFEGGGRLYVYRSHGLHWCSNVVVGDAGQPAAVLLRAGDVTEGQVLAHQRRGDVPVARLARGPGNLASALGITGVDNGAAIPSHRFSLKEGSAPDASVIMSGPRVGVTLAADWNMRFWIEGSPSVSAYRRSPRAPAPGP